MLPWNDEELRVGMFEVDNFVVFEMCVCLFAWLFDCLFVTE